MRDCLFGADAKVDLDAGHHALQTIVHFLVSVAKCLVQECNVDSIQLFVNLLEDGCNRRNHYRLAFRWANYPALALLLSNLEGRCN